jgi:hypothetical protein
MGEKKGSSKIVGGKVKRDEKMLFFLFSKTTKHSNLALEPFKVHHTLEPCTRTFQGPLSIGTFH